MVLYYLYRPSRKKTFITRLCTCRLFNSSDSYIVALGILGVALSLLDLFRILQSGPVLPCNLHQPRIKPGRIVSRECQRDLKLVGLIFSLEYYGLLIYGVITENPTYLLPLLYFYAVIIVIEFFVFLLRIYISGLNLDKHYLISSMFVVFHWIIVYCAYHEEECACDGRC